MKKKAKKFVALCLTVTMLIGSIITANAEDLNSEESPAETTTTTETSTEEIEELEETEETTLNQLIDPETNYTAITLKRNNKVLEVPGGNFNNGAILQQWDYTGSDNQKWSFEKVDDTYYKIVNMATGKVADVKDAATNNGTRVHQWDYVGADNQLWYLEDCGDDYYKIKSKQSNKCLDVVDISTNNGAQIQIWDDVDGDNQKWKIDLQETDIEISLYADANYDKETDTININWQSNLDEGEFDIYTSTDDSNYTILDTVTDENTYAYFANGQTSDIYFKIVQRLNNGVSEESNIVKMVYNSEFGEYGLEDTDGDGLSDTIEFLVGTDKNKVDTDDDDLSDYIEVVILGTNPLKKDTDDNGILDGDEDADQDGLTNLEEINFGTNPINGDSDSEGLLDGEEVNTYGTDPLKEDTDEDGLTDFEEVQLNLDPQNNDSDGDGTPDSEEKIQQNISQDINNEEKQGINNVTVSMDATGYLPSTTNIEDMYGKDILSSDVVGLFGVPVEITSTSDFDEATITFTYDESKLGDTNEDNLAIMWYDEENGIYKVLENSVLDKENNTVSVNTTHFSTYMVVDKEKWFEAWRKNLDYNPNPADPIYYNTVLTIDCSGSMSGNDPITYTYPCSSNSNRLKSCYRISAATNYINAMESSDKAAILLFGHITQLSSKMTNSKNNLLNSLQNIHNNWGTDFSVGLSASIDELNKYNDGSKKIIIFMSDGYSSQLSDTYLDQAKNSNIRIFTVGLGNYVNDTVLQHMADYTNGKYFKAATGSDLIDIYSKIGTVKDIDLTDNDGDGLADIFESAGMKLADGKIIYSDPTKADTDNDGLDDGDEINPEYKYMASSDAGISEEHLKEYAGIYFEMISNPNEVDTDGDGDADYIDPNPLHYQLNDTFIYNATIVYNLAQEYLNKNNIGDVKDYYGRQSEWLVFSFIKYFLLDKYGNHKYCINNWIGVSGNINEGFINYVKTNNIDTYNYFKSTTLISSAQNIKNIDLYHMSATITALLYKSGHSDGFKQGLMPEKHLDNLAGWAGDLQTLVSDCTNYCFDNVVFENYKEYFTECLGNNQSRCGIQDLNSDADAVNIAYSIRKNKNFKEVLTEYYSNGVFTRFSNFKKVSLKNDIDTIGIYTKPNYMLGPIIWPIYDGITARRLSFTNDGLGGYSEISKSVFWNYILSLIAKEEK